MTNKILNPLLFLLLLSAPVLASADAQRDANTLLRLTNINQQFERARIQQTRDIIRTYSLITNDNVNLNLPAHVKSTIIECYENNYDFEKFRQGIADILVDTYTEKELEILVDFYRDQGHPPSEIEAFKQIVAKAETIQTIAAEYILDNSEGCVEEGTQSVLDFIDAEQAAQL